jgi:hypothetical protein
VVTQVASALSPVIGGIIIYKLGYSTLYVFAGSLLLISACMAFLDDFSKKGMHVSGKEIFGRIFDWGILKHILAFGVRTFDEMYYFIAWPLFLFSVVGTVQGSGLLQTISLAIALAVTMATGIFVDKQKFGMMKPGAIMTSLSWIVRAGTRGFLGLAVIDTIYNVGLATLWTPHDALLYAKSGRQKYTMEFWLVHEIIWHFNNFIAAMTMVVFFMFSDQFVWLFMLVGGLNLLALLLPKLYARYILDIRLLA